MARSTAMTERTTEPEHFRLRDLPDELQVKIYEKYFEGSKLTLESHNQASGKLIFDGMPSLNLELVCHHMHSDAKRARSQMTNGTLVVSEGEFFNNGAFVKFVHDTRYSWIRNHIQKLQFLNTHMLPSQRVDWKPVIARCARLQEVEVWVTLPGFPILPSIADVQRTPTKALAQQAVREILADDRVARRTIDIFGPDLLRALLTQRSAGYMAAIHCCFI